MQGFFSFSFQGIRWHCYDRLRVEYIIISGNGEIERASLDSDLLCMAVGLLGQRSRRRIE